MIGEEIENCTQNGGIGNPSAQFIGRQAGKIEEAFGARGIGQHPAERLQRNGGRIGGGGRLSDDCQGLSRCIRVT